MSEINVRSRNGDIALLLLRIVTGAIFIIAGWGKLTGIEGVQGFFGEAGIPAASLMAWVVALVEFVCGIMVLIGYRIRIPALLLALVMVGALIFVKIPAGWSALRIDLALLAITLSLFLMGSGGLAVDNRAPKEPAAA